MASLAPEFSLVYKGQTFLKAEDGLRKLGADLTKAAERVPAILRTALLRHLQLTAAAVIERNSGAWPGGTTANSLSRRSGDAMESLRKGVTVTSAAGGIEGHISGVFYLAIHEYGGTIQAKNAQYLTIPLNAALNSNGTPKKMSAREWNNTFAGTSKAGNLIIFQRQGRNIIPLYVLKKQVKIKARLGLRATQAEKMDVFVGEIAGLIEKAVMG